MVKRAWVLTLGCCLWVSQVQAGDFDGSKNLVCAPIDTLRCVSGDGCTRGEAEQVNLPKFFEVDFAQKRLASLSTDRFTSVLHSMRDEGTLILQGAELGRGWTLTISEADGEMTLSSSGADFAFVVFGACTPR